MASGSFTVVTSNSNVDGKVSWSSTEDVAANTSTVTAELRLWRSNTGYTTYGSGDFNLKIDTDNATVANKSFTLTYNSNTLILSNTAVITHGTDGKKSITISWGGNTDVFDVTEGSGTAVLDTIPRASQINAGYSWTAGGSTQIKWESYSTSFKHDIAVSVNNGSSLVSLGTVASNVTGTSYTWTPDASDMQTIFDYINNDTTSWNQATRITLTTKDSAGNVVGTDTYDGTVSSPAASTTASSLDFNIGSAVTIAITRAYTNLIHTLKFYIGTTLIHTSPAGQTTSYTWTPSASETNAMHQATTTSNTATSKVEITTYYDGTTDQQVRTATSKTGTATVTSPTPVFSTISYYDSNAAIVTLTGWNQNIVQNKSNLIVKVANADKAVPQKYATITKYIATVAGESLTKNSADIVAGSDILFDFATINATANQTVTVTAYDSRGNTKAVTATVTVIPWSPPVIQATAERDDGFLDNTVLVLKGTISPVYTRNSAGVYANRNTVKAADTTYQWRVVGGSYNGATAFPGQTLTMPNYAASNVNLTLTNTSSYEISIVVTDNFGSNTSVITVGKGTPLMFIDDQMKAIGIGKFPAALTDGLDVKGEVRSDIQVTIRNPLNSSATIHVGWKDNIPRIRYGGSGEGSLNGFEIQGTGDSVKFKLTDTGDLTIPGVLSADGILATRIPASSNLNNYTTPGFYYCPLTADAQTISNVATAQAFSLLVERHAGYRQVFTEYMSSGFRTYVRNQYSSTWGEWRLLSGEPSFIQASLATGWTRYSTWALPGYYKDPAGFVYLQGMVAGGAKNTTIFTLPADYVPRASHGHHIFSTANAHLDATKGMDYSRIYVYTDGRVVWMEGGNSTWLSLSGISFFAGQI